jgi:hypothetical protein
MFAQADAQKQPVVVDKMVISDNKVDPNSDLTGLTIDDFTNNHEFDASNTTQNDTSFTVVSVMTNKGFTADYDVNLIGLLAHIGTDTANEKIIAIATGDDPFTLPQDTGTPVQLVPAFTTGFGTATNVTVTVSDEAYVLKSDLDNIFKVNLGSYTPTSELTDYISLNLPADVAKTDAANTFTKQQTLAGGAVDGTGNAIATTKDVSDGDVETLTSAKAYADTKVSGKADDSTVVHTADMRKPASDVAGIEEVNAKQDKIGYTPADDSKVVHDNHDGTININGHSFTPSMLDSEIGENSQPIDTDVNTLAKPGIYYVSGSAPNNPFKALMILEVKIQYDWNTFRGIQIAYELENKSGIAVRSVNQNGSLTGFGSTLPWALLSDDSKVAHLSGANDFDTTPTVNNNPLLLASSLPSDLARTGQANTFSKPQTFSTNPTNGTQVYPIYATADTGGTAANLIASLQSSGFSGIVGVPES